MELGRLVLLAALLAAVVVLTAQGACWRLVSGACEARGGVVVRGASGWPECRP